MFRGCVASFLLPPDVIQYAEDGPQNHLQDLQAGDDHGQNVGVLHSGSFHCVVGVHDGMHTQVHGHEPAARGHFVLVSKACVQQHCAVVVPVDKDEGALPQDDEGRVA